MKKLLAVLLVLAVLIAGAAAWITTKYYIFDGEFYPKDSQLLDLRGEDISLSHYRKLENAFPDSLIMWDVPFQGSRYPNDTTSLEMFAPSNEDLEMLSYFPYLEQLDARPCNDHLSWLPALTAERPEVEVQFNLTLDGTVYSQDAQEIAVAGITPEQCELLPYLTKLQQITVKEGIDEEGLSWLYDYSQAHGMELEISLVGQSITEAQRELTRYGITEEQARLIALATGLEKLHLVEPAVPMETIEALMAALPDTMITWEKTILGVTYQNDATVIDLTDVIARAEGQSPEEKTPYAYGLYFDVMGTKEAEPSAAKILEDHPLPNKFDSTSQIIAEVENALAYLPHAEKVILCGAYLDNEVVAEFRERHREDYEVIWSVRCGDIAVRTDATFFMPTKYRVPSGGFNDFDAYNLRYCEKMVCIDLGHMIITDLEFVRFMPDLKYLVLAHAPVKDLSPLGDCKNLVFLEMDWCDRIEDYSPLLECKALKDLNIGETFGDISAVLEMTWLENLWLVGCEESSYKQAEKALPNTNVAYHYDDPVNGWRQLPNYFIMRDELLMFYMS